MTSASDRPASFDDGRSGPRRSVGAVLAVALLVLLAVPFAAMGVGLLRDVQMRGHVPGGSGGVFEAMVGLGAGLLLAAAAHIGAAAMTWRDPLRGRSPARSLALAGVALGTAALALSLFGARDVAILVAPFPLAYGAVLVALRGPKGK